MKIFDFFSAKFRVPAGQGTTNRGVSHVRILQFGLSLVPGLLLGQFINNSNTLISIRRAKIELENIFTPCFSSHRDLALECF